MKDEYKREVKEKFYKDFPAIKLVTTNTTNLRTNKSWSERRLSFVSNQQDFDAVINQFFKAGRDKGIERPFFIDTEVDLSWRNNSKPIAKIEVDAEQLELGEENER